ncbi:MAG TPA: methyltransferase [Gemmatimonadaceae bacterium]|jgi:protein-S-isoprenylcysteine O-methyltransferase Ste14
MLTSPLPLALVLAALAYLGATGNLFSAAPAAIAAQVAAAALSLWARRSFQQGTFRVCAAPGGAVIRRGPYRFMRHPMYTAMLLFSWTAVLSHWSGTSASVGVAITAVIIARIVAEERLLRAQLPGYVEYAREVKAVVPYLI